MKTRSVISSMVSLVVMFLFIAIAIAPAQTSAAPLTQEGSPLANQNWVRLGGPPGGLGYDIRMNPDNPDTMYVTDAFAGLHMSTDGGKSWFSSNEGIDLRVGQNGDIIPVFSLTVDSNNSQIIWLGTQNKRGIYRSTDGGSTWEKRINGVVEDIGISFRGFTVQPGNSDVVYAAGEISSGTWARRQVRGHDFDMTKGVVYKSTDSGLHWKAVWRGDNLARYVWIDPHNIDVIYVSTGIFDREAANTNVDVNDPGGVGVLKSTDGGQTWDILDAEEGLTGLYIGSLYMNPQNPNILLAGAGHTYWTRAHDQGSREISPGGVFITENGGKTWKQTLLHELITSVEFCLSDPNIAYAAGDFDFYQSRDGGHTWELKLGGRSYGKQWGPPGIVAGYPIDIQCDPRNPERVFANNYGGGNYLTEDGGKTWVDASEGYSGAQMQGGVVVDPANPAHVFGGSRAGLFSSTDGGFTWTGLAFSPVRHGEILAIAVNPTDPQIVLNMPWDLNTIARSTTGGANWQIASISLPYENYEGVLPMDLAFAPSNSQVAYAAIGVGDCKVRRFESCERDGAGIYRSDNGGKTWQSSNDSNTRNLNVQGIIVDPNDANIVYAAASRNGVYKTSDGGNHWDKLSLKQQTWTLALDPLNTNKIFVGTNNGIYISMDAGVTWKASSAGLNPGAMILAIAVDPSNPQIVWVGDFLGGIYVSNDSGKNWTIHNDGLTNRDVVDLAISQDGTTLYAATNGEGVFRLSTRDQAYFDSLVPTPTIVPPTITSTSVAAEIPVADTATPISAPTAPVIMQESSRNPFYIGAAIILLLGLVLFVQWRNKSRR